MRRPTTWALLAICAFIGAGNRADAETAKEVIQKAIDAHGGADNLKKYPAAKVMSKGKLNILGMELAFESDSTFQLPDLLKNVLKLDVMGMKIEVVQIYNAGKVKVTAAGMAPPVTEAQKGEIKQSLYLQGVTNLVPLLDGAKYELSSIDSPDKVNGKEVVGMVVKSTGHKDVKVFFDKKTYLLLKMERKGLDPMEKEVDQQMIFLDYKKINGVMHPSKSELLMEGKKFMESELVDYKDLDKVDKKEFDISD
jgi:hypothetical protein